MQYNKDTRGFRERTFADDVLAFKQMQELDKVEREKDITFAEAIGIDPYDWYKESYY